MPSCTIITPLGHATIVGDTDGISSVLLGDYSTKLSEIIPEELLDCVVQLKAYFRKELQVFSLKLNPSGTNFQKKVWKQLCEIPFGKTTTYLQLSKDLGHPKAIRAVANANGKNPLWVIVPCHRVIGSNGNLTGYAGGLHRKKWLINHENKNQQQYLF